MNFREVPGIFSDSLQSRQAVKTVSSMNTDLRIQIN